MLLNGLKRMAEEPSWGKMFSSWLREASLLMNLFVKGSGERCLSKVWLGERSERMPLILMNLFVKGSGERCLSKAWLSKRSERTQLILMNLFVKGSGVLI